MARMRKIDFKGPGRFATLFVLIVALPGCGARSSRVSHAVRKDMAVRTHENLHPVLWMQTAAEYQGLAEQAYRSAHANLERALLDSRWTAAIEQEGDYSSLPPAVVMDLDETVVDNSPCLAQFVLEEKDFDSDTWNRWVRKAEAAAVPGAISFIQSAKGRGVEVFYITNRGSDSEEHTRRNLANLKIPLESKVDTVLTQDERPEWNGDKSSRRKFVAQRYRILLLVGDDFNDFVSAKLPLPEREQLSEEYRERWGVSWIVLPNIDYGSWEKCLSDSKKDKTREARLRSKYTYLRPFEP